MERSGTTTRMSRKLISLETRSVHGPVIGGADWSKKQMLTKEEQTMVVDFVKRMLKTDRIRRSKVRTMVISEKSAKSSEEDDLNALKDLLKEIG